MVAAEAASQPAPSMAQAMAPDVGRTEGDMAKGSLDVVAVAERTGRESSLALTSRDSHSPTWDEPLLRWMNPQDPMLTLFTLDDAAESMEWESLDEGIAAMLQALNHAQSALREVAVPTG